MTQDNFKKIGEVVVNYYIHCSAHLDIVDHLLVLYLVTIWIWCKVLKVLQAKGAWGKDTFSGSLRQWYLIHSNLVVRHFVGLISWNIWIFKNYLFRDSTDKDLYLVVGSVVKDFKEFVPHMGKHVSRNKKSHIFHKKFPWCFFDGACNNCTFGCGIIINLFYNNAFYLQLGVGVGSNSKAQLLVVWGLL